MYNLSHVCNDLNLFLDMVGSEVGLCVSQCLILLTMVQSGIRYMSEAANNMTSVERLLEYTEIEQEAVMDLATGLYYFKHIDYFNIYTFLYYSIYID